MVAIMYVFRGFNVFVETTHDTEVFQSPRQIGPHVLLPAVRIPRNYRYDMNAKNTPKNGTRSGFPQVNPLQLQTKVLLAINF